MPRTLRTSNPVRQGHPLNQGCVAWWLTLPHTQGTATWFDLMGTNHGSLVSMGNANNGWRPTHRPGGYGHVLFDGTAGYALCRSSAILSGKSNWAIAAWVKTTTSADVAVYCERGTTGNDIVKLELHFGGSIFLTYRNDAGNLIQFGGVNKANDGAWHRGIVVFNGTAFSIFFDGRADGSSSWANPNTLTDAVQVRIGADAADATANFPGSIDGVKLWTGNSLAISNPAAFAAFEYDQSIRGNPDTLNYF